MFTTDDVCSMDYRNPCEMLMVAVDFQPDQSGRAGVRKRVMKLAEKLEGTDVYIKVNSVLRACGYRLIDDLHDLGLKVCADLKLKDISNTMATDGKFLAEAEPEIITVLCDASVMGMMRLKEQLQDGDGFGDTELLGVTVLTDFDEEECQQVYGCSTEAGVVRLARLARLAGLNGLVLSAKEVEVIHKRPELAGLSLNTPAIRPKWAQVKGDDQAKKRRATPEEAIKRGVDRLIIGRPIVESSNPYDAVQKTLEEIQQALSSLD